MDQGKIKGWVRPEIYQMQPYAADCVHCRAKLDANENPYDLPAGVKEEVYADLARIPFNRYPEATAERLRGMLAEEHGVGIDQVLVGSGSSELLLAIALTFGGAGRNIVFADPSFSMYPVYAAIAGAQGLKVPLRRDFTLDPDAVLAAANRPGSKVVILCSPNNPTGNVIPHEEIMTIVTNTDRVVVVDEAYYEFSRATVLPELANHPNLVVLRTFSKAYGMAGARVGYLIAHPQLAQAIGKVILPYNVNALSLTVVATVLSRREAFTKRIGELVAARDRLAQELARIPGITVYPSQANFLLIRTAKPEGKVAADLMTAGVGVRNLGKHPALENCLRVTVGTPEENDLLVTALTRIMKGE